MCTSQSVLYLFAKIPSTQTWLISRLLSQWNWQFDIQDLLANSSWPLKCLPSLVGHSHYVCPTVIRQICRSYCPGKMLGLSVGEALSDFNKILSSIWQPFQTQNICVKVFINQYNVASLSLTWPGIGHWKWHFLKLRNMLKLYLKYKILLS